MIRIIAGLAIFALGLWAIVSWWCFIWVIIRGLIAILFILGGLTLIRLGIRDRGRKPQKQNRKYYVSLY